MSETLGKLLLLGSEYGQYGTLAVSAVGSNAALAISVGTDPNSPGSAYKGNRDEPNEDAVCAIEAGVWSGYAVADAHFGSEASHAILERLQRTWERIPPESPEHLAQMVEFLGVGDPPLTDSMSTFLVVFYNREERAGYGLSFGDSSFSIVGEGRMPELINDRSDRYVNASPRSLRGGRPFSFATQPGDMLLLHTDGVDECHYRQPETSVRPHHVAAVRDRTGAVPEKFARSLLELALEGVDGNPGGQDNIAIAVALA